MSDIDMNNLMEQFNKMLQNNEFPDELKSALNNLKIPLIMLILIINLAVAQILLFQIWI